MTLTHLDLELTTACNLRCPYCYIGQGACQTKATISNETLEDALDLIAMWGLTQPKGKQQATECNFYGGEPLLAFDQLRYFVEGAKARGYKLRYCVISNGTIDKPDIVDYCKHNGIKVQRSLDGCPEAMELCRGAGTLEKYNEATQVWQDYDWTRRSTIIPATAKYIAQSLKYFEQQGFRKGISPQPDYYADWSPQEIEDFRESLWELGSETVRDVRAGRGVFHTFWFQKEFDRFKAVPNRGYKSSIGCGAGKGLWCCSWDGYLFICHRFASESRDSEWCVGRVRDVVDGTARGLGTTVQANLQRYWRKQTNPECSDCIGRYGCTMGCYHVNHKCTGSMLTPPPLYCTIKRETAQVVTWIDQRLRDQDSRWWSGRKQKQKQSAK